MTLPRKGTRTLDVDGRQFRYVVNKVKDEKLSVTVEDATQPGCVFNYTWPEGHSVYPSDVKVNVQAALKAGWKPENKGPAFRLSEVHFPAHPHNN